MSATNWAVCPRCYDNLYLGTEKRNQEINSLYGKIPLEEFTKLQKEAASPPSMQDLPESSYTFREDYEIYNAESGCLVIDYHGQCTKCNLRFVFNDSFEFYISS